MNTRQRLDASMEFQERSDEEFSTGGNTMIAAELLWGAYAQLSLAVAELKARLSAKFRKSIKAG